eukprot:498290-Rhodomonas_salina.1
MPALLTIVGGGAAHEQEKKRQRHKPRWWCFADVIDVLLLLLCWSQELSNAALYRHTGCYSSFLQARAEREEIEAAQANLAKKQVRLPNALPKLSILESEACRLPANQGGRLQAVSSHRLHQHSNDNNSNDNNKPTKQNKTKVVLTTRGRVGRAGAEGAGVGTENAQGARGQEQRQGRSLLRTSQEGQRRAQG